MVMSNGSSPTASGSVLAGGLSRWSVVPAGISTPSTVMSSTACRVVQTTVGFHRITSSTAFAASSGRCARSSHWSGRLDEELHRQPELVLGRVHAAEDDQRDHRQELLVRQAAVAVVGGDEGRDHVVARGAAALGDQLVGEPVHLRERRLDLAEILGDRDAEREADVGRPVREVAPAALVEADQAAQHARRVRLGELRHELAPAALGERVDELGREQAEAGHHPLHQRAREGRVREPAQAAVIVALGAQHDAATTTGAAAPR